MKLGIVCALIGADGSGSNPEIGYLPLQNTAVAGQQFLVIPWTFPKGQIVKHIATSELGYYLIQELVTMPDRELAKRIELAIWKDSPVPEEETLNKFIKAIEESENESDFAWKAREILGEC